MKVGISVECRSPQGSVAFQSQVDVDEETVRFCRKELEPGQTWVWRMLPIDRDRVAFFSAQSMYPVTLQLGGHITLLEGQMTSDFGIIYARRDLETLGTLPCTGPLSEITVINDSQKKNRIDIMLGEIPDASLMAAE